MRLLLALSIAAVFAAPYLRPTLAFYASKEYRAGVNLNRAKDVCLGAVVANFRFYREQRSLSELCSCALSVHANNQIFQQFFFDFTALSQIKGFDEGLDLCLSGFNKSRL